MIFKFCSRRLSNYEASLATLGSTFLFHSGKKRKLILNVIIANKEIDGRKAVNFLSV